MSAELDGEGRLRLMADSDSELTRGLAALLVEGLSGLTLEELLQVGLEPLQPPARTWRLSRRSTLLCWGSWGWAPLC